MSALRFNLHVFFCRHCRTFLDRLHPDVALSFLCRKGWRRAQAMLRAKDLPVPRFPDFVEKARP